jgi:hypothetical protein
MLEYDIMVPWMAKGNIHPKALVPMTSSVMVASAALRLIALGLPPWGAAAALSDASAAESASPPDTPTSGLSPVPPAAAGDGSAAASGARWNRAVSFSAAEFISGAYDASWPEWKTRSQLARSPAQYLPLEWMGVQPHH